MNDCARTPETSAVHPALSGRFSPLAFDPVAVMSEEQVDALIDAARLAPSAGNSQPWAFIVGRRGDAVHQRLTVHLARSSSAWAIHASLLVVNLCHVSVEDAPDWEYSEFSRYDLGQSVAHMTVQGLTMGFDARQFRAFDRTALATEFDVPAHWEVTSIIAFGIAGRDPVAAATPRLDRRERADVIRARVDAAGDAG